MTSRRGANLLAVAALLCFALIVAEVIWASDRGLELTDEAYYLLSAIHPEEIKLYISAQHWILAPLWWLTESLQRFRLAGAVILIGSTSVLAMGALRAFGDATIERPPRLLDQWMTLAAGNIGALLYVTTIAPSPSYNLLASSGAYSGLGFALLSLWRARLAAGLCLSGLSGAALSVCFVNKPSAGFAVAIVVLLTVLLLERSSRKWVLCAAGAVGGLGAVALMVIVQPHDPSVMDSLRGGLDLFRMVQTESVIDRLIRYGVTLLKSFAASLTSFWPVILLIILSWRYRRRWLYVLTLLVWITNLFIERNYLSGMSSQVRMAEAIYVLVFVIAVFGLRESTLPTNAKLLLGALFVLPFAVSNGTGNSLFTQVIVTLAPWTIGVALLSLSADTKSPAIFLQRAATGLLFVLLWMQITTSYLRDPYHLAEPLIRQTEAVTLPTLGTIKVDPQTRLFLSQIAEAKQTCALAPGGSYFGLFNLPGLALVLQLVPRVTPWLNNSEQAATVLRHWSPATSDRIVIALSADVRATPAILPMDLRPAANGYAFCGYAVVPYGGQTIEIWASREE